jgi:hypothetical protein
MSDINPTNSKSYRPGDEEKGYNDLVTIVLTKRECSDLLTAMNELTAGPYAPSKEEWEWLENVMGMPTQDSLLAICDKMSTYAGNALAQKNSKTAND